MSEIVQPSDNQIATYMAIAYRLVENLRAMGEEINPIKQALMVHRVYQILLEGEDPGPTEPKK